MNQDVQTTRERIAQLARRYEGQALTSIHHLMGVEMLAYAFGELDGSKSPGIDDLTKAEYGEDLGVKLEDLLTRVRKKEYRAPPVKRVEIPKGSGETRPIGIPAIEDKVLQKAFVTLVEPIFEQEFYNFSKGFRPGKSQHEAIKELRARLMWDGKIIIDLDIRKFFDTIPKGKLQEAFRKRIKDGVLDRLIVSWLNAGIMKNGQWEASEAGTPQGGTVSPLLANLYLHDVLDKWFVEDIQPLLKGGSGMVRYADDAVLYFEELEDAQRVLEELAKRLEEYGLSLHPEKTKLLDFRTPRRGGGKTTFDFLGFTFYWGKTRNRTPVVKMKTARKKLTAKLDEFYQWCKDNRHLPMWQQRWLIELKLKGHYQYYGVSHNFRSLSMYYRRVREIWRKWLNRRGGGKPMTYEKLDRYLQVFPLSRPRIVHSLF